MTLQEILPRLQNVKKSGNGYSAQCPSHNDENNSLVVKAGTRKFFLDCYAKICSENDICAALGIEVKDLFFEPYQAKQSTIKNGYSANTAKKIVAVYPYADESGELLYENVRFEPKDFRQRRFDADGKEIWSLNGTRRVPYRLPELIEALKETQDVFLCEGEKDADNVRELGLAATSFKNWKPEFNSFLKTSHVYLIQDHDASGVRQAADAANIICGNVQSLKVIDLFADEPLPDKHGRDVSDWIETQKEQGLSEDEIAEKLCIFTDNADVWQPTNAGDNSRSNTKEKKPLKRLKTVKMSDVQTQKVKWLWQDYIPQSAFTILEGEEGLGKIGCFVLSPERRRKVTVCRTIQTPNPKLS